MEDFVKCWVTLSGGSNESADGDQGSFSKVDCTVLIELSY